MNTTAKLVAAVVATIVALSLAKKKIKKKGKVASDTPTPYTDLPIEEVK